MTKFLVHCSFLLVLILGFISCEGQVKQQSSEPIPEEQTSIQDNPLLTKTQGSTPADNVHCSLQDQSGNLWFGTTREGLYRFDGRSFTQYTVSNGLNHNMVNDLLEDRDGIIWIATNGGVQRYDGKSFRQFPILTSLGTPLARKDVFSLMQDQKGQLWFATIEGVYIYDGQDFTPLIIDKDGKGYRSERHNVEYMLEDLEGDIWFGGRGNSGVFCYNGTTVIHYDLENRQGHDWAWPLLQDQKGDIWFTNWAGVFRYDGKSFTSITEQEGLCNNTVARIMEDSHGHLWFGTAGKQNGICRYDGESFTHIVTNHDPLNYGVWTILEDRDGYIWVGTRNTGLYRYDGNTFTPFSETNSAALLPQH